MELLILTGVLVLAIILAIFSILFVWWLVESFILDAPFLPLPQPIVNQLVSVLRLTPGTEFYDLGCGDGRILTTLARKYPEIRFIGIEKALIPSVWLWIKARITHQVPRNLYFYRKDYRSVDLVQADAVFMYLWPEAMTVLEEKCREELRPGSLAIVCRFPFPNQKPIKTDQLTYQGHNYHVYHYRF